MSANNLFNSIRLYRYFRDRLFIRLMGILLLAACIFPLSSAAQFKFRETPNRRLPDKLDDYNEQRLWSDFLSARYLGKFSLVGTLKYRPARNTSRLFDFQLNGDWNPIEQISELNLSEHNAISFSRKVAIRDGKVMSLDDPQGPAKDNVIKDEELSTPLMDGLPFTWNDILMPYIRWKNVNYLGPVRYIGRPAHQFVLINTEHSAKPAKVIVTVDEDFAVLLKSDVLDKDDNVLKRIRVNGFKQFNEEWMFSELVWEHRISRESVLLKVTDFSLDSGSGY